MAMSGIDSSPAPSANQKRKLAKRRQWGTDSRTGASPIIHGIPTRRALSWARFALFFTMAAWGAYMIERVWKFGRTTNGVRDVIETVVYMLIVTMLSLAGISYLLARMGHMVRVQAHERTPRAVIDNFFAESIPTLTVIVPSYREDRRVIFQTLVSAGLQEYPHMRVVLLVDDPPNPTEPDHVKTLEDSRRIADDLNQMFREPRRKFEAALDRFESSDDGSEFVEGSDLEHLADVYDEAGQWFADTAAAHEIFDHSDAFLVDEVYMRLETELRTIANALRSASVTGTHLSRTRVQQLYRRLAWTFRAEFSTFERKQYASLSHEANKAMNLNSYIGLMGGSYRVQDTATGPVLLPVRGEAWGVTVPDADYVLTLDADSTLLPEYCLRLVHFMEQPENADVAVVQTPYSSYRGAPTRIERIAGATTDIQHLVHQGMTQYNATFWVGANAVIRKPALEAIGVDENHGGFHIKRYIQDRTVIEDTESSIDMRAKDWRLYNYPERLSYSATPPDFGSLAVQRQRWSNGGLVILPKLIDVWKKRKTDPTPMKLPELLLRSNYLASICWVSIGLVMLLVYPFNQALLSPLAVFTALPYFACIAGDLRRTGYRRRDVFQLYGLNLLLLPVNISGVVKSVGQAIGGQKIAFARTPKVKNRTVAQLSFVVIPWVIVIWSTYTFINDIKNEHYIHAVFAFVNAAMTLYGILAFIGLGHSLYDVGYGIINNTLVPAKSKRDKEATPNWVTVLYHGRPVTGENDSGVAMAAALSAVDQQNSGGDTILLGNDARIGATESPVVAKTHQRAEEEASFDDLSKKLAEHFALAAREGRLSLEIDHGQIAVRSGSDTDNGVVRASEGSGI